MNEWEPTTNLESVNTPSFPIQLQLRSRWCSPVSISVALKRILISLLPTLQSPRTNSVRTVRVWQVQLLINQSKDQSLNQKSKSKALGKSSKKIVITTKGDPWDLKRCSCSTELTSMKSARLWMADWLSSSLHDDVALKCCSDPDGSATMKFAIPWEPRALYATERCDSWEAAR